MIQQDREYLGDGVYVGHDGYQIWLTAENGVQVLHKIALERQVLEALIRYAKSVSMLPKEGSSV